MVGAALAIPRVAMAGQNNLDAHFGSPLHDRVEVFHLEPEQHTIAVGLVGGIADRTVMMLDFKAVQLQDERAILHQLLVLLATVGPAAAQQALIPAAAGFYIRNANKRLGVHGTKVYQKIRLWPSIGGLSTIARIKMKIKSRMKIKTEGKIKSWRRGMESNHRRGLCRPFP
jgi:hypothetical protein